MKTVYEAASSVDAHMMTNLLRVEGFDAHVNGDFLQGGAGELQAFGAVSVWVADQDFEAARHFVVNWEMKSD